MTDPKGDGAGSSKLSQAEAFERAATRAARARTGPVGEFAYFIRRTGKYWLIPVLVSLLLIGVFVVGSGSAIAPLLYALF